MRKKENASPVAGSRERSPRQKTLAGRLTVRMVAVMLLIFAVMITVITTTTRSTLVEQQLKSLELLAKENAQIAEGFMSVMLDKQEVLVSAIQTLESAAPETRSATLSTLLDKVGENQEDILSLFFVAEPNAFLPDTPNGFSISTSAAGARSRSERYAYVSQSGYEKGFSAAGVTILDPFETTIDGASYQVITVLLPVTNALGQTIGVVGSNIDTQVLTSASYDTGGFETFNNQIICGHQTVIINSRDPGAVGKPFAEITISKDPSRILESAQTAEPLTILDKLTDGTSEYRAYIPFYVGSSTTPWLSGASISQQEFDRQIIAQVLLMAAIATAALLVLALFCYFFTRRMLKPLSQLEHAMQELNKGSLQRKLDYHSNDELGRVAVSFNEATETIYGYVKDIDRAMGEMARGNFDVYPSKPFIGDFSGFESSITNFIGKICNTLYQIHLTADSVAAGSSQLANAGSVLSQGATEQAAAVEELSASIAELTNKVQQNNDSAKLAAQRVNEAGAQLEISDSHMMEMTHAMREITENSAQIDKIIKTIEDIAFQTNILALNAAVEAARAGAAGKGFAVVADEVRNLAGKSAEAAKSTTAMIQDTIASVQKGSRIADEAAESLKIVQERAGAVVGIVEDIRLASQVQLEHSSIVSTSSRQISDVIQTNAATAEESAATSEELSAQSSTLKNLVTQFTLNKLLTKF